MVYCIAPGCKNKSTRRSDLTFYRFPLRDEPLLKRWFVNLRRSNIPQWLDSCAVCSEHFEPECFGRDLKAELLGERPKPPLLKGAVPTLFLYNNFKAHVKRRVFSEQRRKRKEKEEILKDLLGPYYHMKPLAQDKQNFTPERAPASPMEEAGAEDEKFSIQSLLSNFAVAQGNEASNGCDRTRSNTDDDVTTALDKARTSANDRSMGTIHEAGNCHQGNQSSTSETSCQTDEKHTTEISCQTNKPCMVTTETQWDEKDFLPDPELVQKDHSYCKRKRSSK